SRYTPGGARRAAVNRLILPIWIVIVRVPFQGAALEPGGETGQRCAASLQRGTAERGAVERPVCEQRLEPGAVGFVQALLVALGEHPQLGATLEPGPARALATHEPVPHREPPPHVGRAGGLALQLEVVLAAREVTADEGVELGVAREHPA